MVLGINNSYWRRKGEFLLWIPFYYINGDRQFWISLDYFSLYYTFEYVIKTWYEFCSLRDTLCYFYPYRLYRMGRRVERNPTGSSSIPTPNPTNVAPLTRARALNGSRVRSLAEAFRIIFMISYRLPELKAQVSFSDHLSSVVHLSVNFSPFYFLHTSTWLISTKLGTKHP